MLKAESVFGGIAQACYTVCLECWSRGSSRWWAVCYWEHVAVGTEKSRDGKVTRCIGGLWNKDRDSWEFLVLQRLKSSPINP